MIAPDSGRRFDSVQGEDVPTPFTRRERVLWRAFFIGGPVLLITTGGLLVLHGLPVALLPMLTVFALVQLLLGALGLRGADLVGWNSHGLHFGRGANSEVVPWDSIERFWKVAPRLKFDGRGAWVSVRIRYRSPAGPRQRWLVVLGKAPNRGFGLPLMPWKYETVFDQRIPQRNYEYEGGGPIPPGTAV
jgi:hypothetical protein